CLLSGGVLDPTFDTDGIVTTSVASIHFSSAYAVATYPQTRPADDGKVVAAGWVNPVFGKYQGAVVRYNRHGSLDTSFDHHRQVTTKLTTGPNMAGDVKVQPDGKVVVAGWTGDSNSDFALVRYNYDGSLDTAFGGASAKGKVLTDINHTSDYGLTMALQADGK